MSRLFPGCQIECRLIGVILGLQKDQKQEKESRNDRILAVAEASVLYAGVSRLSDLPPAVLKQIEEFFVNYQKVRQVDFKSQGHEEAPAAKRLLEKASEHSR